MFYFYSPPPPPIPVAPPTPPPVPAVVGVSALPTSPTGLTKTLPAYLYEQYADDTSLEQIVQAYNQLTQQMLNWFNATNLPIYTQFSGAMLDWVAAGIYGIVRPVLTTGTSNTSGVYNTMPWNVTDYNTQVTVGTAQFIPVTDDVFQRIITWHIYRGDGYQFTPAWLKRRVHRFLNGIGGVPPNPEDNTDDVSVSYSGSNITITVPNSEIGLLFSYAVQNGVLALPFQYNFTVNT